MKKVIALLVVLILAFSANVSVFAAESNVIYSGDSGEFIFSSENGETITDLFTEFKDVMPGDSLTQKITVENKASNDVEVKIYLRSLGANEESVDFLSKLNLSVKLSDENEENNLFDAEADKTAGLTDWVCLGTLQSGGKVNLDVLLNVPVELDNAYQNSIGSLDWEFKVEEFPIEEEKPDVDDSEDTDEPEEDKPSSDKEDQKVPQTGDNSNIALWIGVLIGSSALMFLIVLLKNKRRKEDSENN